MKRARKFSTSGRALATRAILAVALTATVLGAAATSPAAANILVVNTTTDQATGSCATTCSLRDAVATANPGDTVQIPAGHYVLTLGQITVAQNLTISGAGARSTVLDGNNASRILQITSRATASISDAALVNGLAAGDSGGAILVDRAGLTLERSLVANSQADFGGGLVARGSSVTIDQSTFTGNRAAASGGGGVGLVFAGGTISNSTFTGNSTTGAGGAVEAGFATVTLLNAAITGNQAPTTGGLSSGGVGPGGLSLILTNSIVAANPGGDCDVPAGSSDHSLDGDNSCGLTTSGDLPGVNPLLGPLANNGGPTDTTALLPGSPAIDAGDNATCLPTDQRGVPRPQGPACDIGAFEVETPQGQIAALTDAINALVTSGALAQNHATPLTNKLNQVLAKLNASKLTPACNHLGAFINQVNADINSGILTAADGQALISAANAIETSLGC